MFVRRLLITALSWSTKFNRRPFKLFVLAIALSIAIGIAQPLHSQSVSFSQDDCQATVELCEQIRQQAQQDVADDIPRRTDYAINRFKTLHPQWETNSAIAELDIGNTYDREYSEQTKAKKRNLFAALESWSESGLLVPFIGVVLLAIAGWFKDAIGKAVTTFFQKIDDWIYARFAGTPLFQGEALKRYRKALVDNYQHLKIPFRANQAPLDMSQVYVPLKVKGTSANEQIDAYSAIAQHRRLMITGIPGSGKTMLLKHVAFSYGQGRLMGLSPQPVPVLLEMHRLSDPNLTEEKLIAELVEAFKRNQFPKAERFVRLSLQKGTLMLLLDGLDEVNSATRPLVVQRIKDLLQSFDEQRCCRVIVTCRTAVYDHEFADTTDQTLEVVEFTDQQMRRFLDPWQDKMPKGKSTDQLMQTLRDRPRVMALARNPLMLTMIVHLYTDPSFELPRSRTEFYQKSTQLLLEQWQDKFNTYRGNDKRRVLQYLALHHQRSSTQQQRDPRSMDYTVVLQQIREVLPSLNLNPDTDTIPLLDEIVERSGLFMKIDGGDRYQFAHLTLQEYFAAVALADKPDELIQLFQQDPNQWREVVKLWCGIAGNSTALIQQVYHTDAITGFECLADAQEVDQFVAVSIIDDFTGLIGSVEQSDLIAQAFAAVAADDRPRGRAVFQFLVDALDDETQADRHRSIAQVLSMTNSPKAASIFAERYQTHSEIVDLWLIRMGDISIPALADLARNGNLSALADLHVIGTPDAAKALTEMFLDNKQTGRAAWYLASILSQPRVEEALQNYIQIKSSKLKALERIWKPFDWVWHSKLSNLSDISMTAIIGCIAAEISKEVTTNQVSIESSASKYTIRVDPRIGIPLVSQHILFDQRWDSTFDPLLETQAQTPELEQGCNKAINTLINTSPPDIGWRFLLSGLSSRLQLDLLRSLMTATRRPTPRDWREILQPLKYEFQSGWHYRGALLIAATLTLTSGLGIWNIVTLSPTSPITGLAGFAAVVIFAFWATLSEGIDTAWEPTLFAQLGPRGLITYILEFRFLWQKRLVWSGVISIFNSLDSAIAVAIAVVIIVAIADSVAVAFAIAIAMAVAVGFAVAIARSFAVTIADFFAMADAVAFAVAIAVAFAVAMAIAFAGAGAFAGLLAGVGLGAWYRLKEEPDNGWLKWLAVLALPWFCAGPIVLGFGLVGLHVALSALELPYGLVWLQALGVEGALVGLGCLLWWQGQWLEARARNPLQGGLIEKMLREKYGHLHR